MEDSKPQINGVPADIPDDILKNVDLFHDIDRIVKKRGRNRARGKPVKPPEKQGAFCLPHQYHNYRKENAKTNTNEKRLPNPLPFPEPAV